MNPLDLHDLIADEPPYFLLPDDAVRAGRRRRSRRRALAAGTTAAAVTGTALALTAGGGGPTSQLQVGASQSPSTAALPGDPITQVVRQHTPASWSIDEVTVDPKDGNDYTGWQGYVDDGQGRARLYLGFSPHPGSLQQHPCGDPEFVQGASCVETQLGADRRLVVRGVRPVGHVKSVFVVIVHTDGGGVSLDADNATFPAEPPAGTVVTPAEKLAYSTGTVTRPAPPYTTDQLVELAKALDELSV
jgi:hypothetical protein